MSLEGRTAVVTGAAQGPGKAIAGAWASVIVADVNVRAPSGSRVPRGACTRGARGRSQDRARREHG